MLKIKEKTRNTPKYNYPLAFKSRNDTYDKRIILFISLREGFVIKEDKNTVSSYPLGRLEKDWTSHEEACWEPVDVEITH